MEPEPGILDPDQPLQEGGVRPVQVSPDPPPSVLHGQGPKPGASPVKGHRRGPLSPTQIRREGRIQGEDRCLKGQKDQEAVDYTPDAGLLPVRRLLKLRGQSRSAPAPSAH